MNNQPFAENSWYFRNVLVRANYNDLAEGVTADSRFLEALGDDELSSTEPMDRLSLKHRPTFLYTYLHPAIEVELVELTIPDKPNSRLQKYRKTSC